MLPLDSSAGSENTEVNDVWAVIPARGGSIGIPRKNLRIVAGAPLIVHCIRTALSILSRERVIVITDSDEIAELAEQSSAQVIYEQFPTPPSETLDTKIVRNLDALRNLGAKNSDIILTLQPTSPLTRDSTIRTAIRTLKTTNYRSVVTVAEDRHLRWRKDKEGIFEPQFTKRVNRQELPLDYRETGGIIGAKLGDITATGTRINNPVFALPVTAEEAIDIDSHADLYVAAHFLTRKKVAVRVDAAYFLGMGHVYRALALVTELARHDVRIYIREDYPLSCKFFSDKPYPVVKIRDESDFQSKIRSFRPDLVVLDILDTSDRYVESLREASPGTRIVTFEDRGSGAARADLVVAEFVNPPAIPQKNLLEGIGYSLLAPRFELQVVSPPRSSEAVAEILVLFGGTDPSGLANMALEALKRVNYRGHVTVVRGMGAGDLFVPDDRPFSLDVLENVNNMPLLMASADFALTSAGRTIVELAAMGTPAICLAQNEKEMRHTHAVEGNGVLALGLGTMVSTTVLDSAIRLMIDDKDHRLRLARYAHDSGKRRKNRHTVSAIFERLGFDSFPDL